MKKPSHRGRQRVALAGETALMEEFAPLCAAGGYGVARIPSKGVTAAIELSNLAPAAKRRNLRKLDRALRPGALIFSSAVTVTLAEQSTWLRHPERLVGICAFPTFQAGKWMECVFLPGASPDVRASAGEFIRSLGKEPVAVEDSVGMVLPRVICCLANEAHFAQMEGVAPPDAIDTAMKLGTRYPAGPFEWTRKIGVKYVVAVLQAMHGYFGEERYRPAPALRRAADLEDSGGIL